MSRSSTVALQRDVVDAIKLSSPELLKSVIAQGYDINLPLCQKSVYSVTESEMDDDDFEPNEDETVALDSNNSSYIYPLHLAVITLYHAASYCNNKGAINNPVIEKSLTIMRILLRNGADGRLQCKDALLINTAKYKWLPWEEPHRNTAMHLASFLKKHDDFLTTMYMGEAMEILDGYAPRQKKMDEKKKPRSLETAPVLKSVTSSYSNLLFDEDFSDVSFHCSDGETVHAHKAILAASSPYFRTAFQGNWAENNAEGIWNTTHSSTLIRSVLTLIYTGSVSECEKLLREKGNDPLGLLDVACEYDISPLKKIAVVNCIKKVNPDNIRMMLQTSNLHSQKKLKRACFEYIKKNATTTLINPDMMSLATEDPELWGELGTFLNGKRPRTSE